LYNGNVPIIINKLLLYHFSLILSPGFWQSGSLADRDYIITQD